MVSYTLDLVRLGLERADMENLTNDQRRASRQAQETTVHSFQVDDTHQGDYGAPGNGHYDRQTSAPWTLPARPILTLFAFPFHVLTNVFRFLFGILRIPVPQFRFVGLNLYRPLRRRPTSRGGPDKWVRELEEETGAVCINRKTSHPAEASGIDAGPSSLTARANAHTEDGRKLLPNFTLGSYEDTLKLCQREAKIGCIILVSEEHDDVTEFKRSTLTDPGFVKLLYDNDVIVWGGDVRDQEAWSAAEKLQATTYPFVAFLALQPRRNPVTSSVPASRTSIPPTLTVLSRHQGKSVPTAGPTSAQTLVEHFERQVLPRVGPFLERIRSVQRERERDRQLREEQDRAFQDSARRDTERIYAKMAAERAEAEETRRIEAEAIAEEQRRLREAEEFRKRESKRMEWRRWSRKALVAPQSDDPAALRIAFRLPDGDRIIHRFDPNATLTALYTFVDSRLIPSQFLPADDPATIPEGVNEGEASISKQIAVAESAAAWWGFQVVLAYPRKEIAWQDERRLCDVESLHGGGQVVVEMLGMASPQQKPNGGGGTADDDGYNTEDSE